MMITILFILTLLVVLMWRDTKKPKGYPPGPKWIPFIGVFPLVTELHSIYKYYHLVWHHISKIYGPVVGIRLGFKKIILVSGREAMKEMFAMEEMDGRPDGFFFKVRTFNKKLGVVFTDGHFWDEQRRFSMRTLKQLGLGKNGMIQQVEREAYALVDYYREKSKSQEPIEMEHAFDISVLNVMWSMLAGYRFELSDERLGQLMIMIHRSFRVLDMSGGILLQIPFLRFFFPEMSGYKPLVDAHNPLWVFLRTAISEIRDNVSDEEPRSLIEAFIKEMECMNRQTFTDEQLLALCIDFFQAGSETTSNSLSFGVLYMLHNPIIKDKVCRILDEVVGRNRLPSLNDRPQLKYIEAVMYEIQRISNVAPLGIAHRALKQCKLQGFTIPESTTVIFSLYSLHMDSKYWVDPFVFRPERFLDANGNLVQHDFFMPFGSGKRRCMGENFAKSSLFLFFASFMHAFDFSVAIDDKTPELDPQDGITLSPKPYRLILHSKF